VKFILDIKDLSTALINKKALAGNDEVHKKL
jgi:hypothetical protein